MEDSKINTSTNHIKIENAKKSTSYLSGINLSRLRKRLGNMYNSATGALRRFRSRVITAATDTPTYISNKLDAFKGSVDKIKYDIALEKTDIKKFTEKDKYESIKIMDKKSVEEAENKETLCLSSGMGGHAGAFVNVCTIFNSNNAV